MSEQWHRNGFNLCEVIVIRDGPDSRGYHYKDGRHQVRVALFERIADAEQACIDHNARLEA